MTVRTRDGQATGREPQSRLPARFGEPLAQGRAVVSTAGNHVRRWLHIPADPAGSPFATVRRRLLVTNMAVVAIVLAVLGIAVYLLNGYGAQQETLAQLKYSATSGSNFLLGHSFEPPSGGDQGPDQFVPYSPSSPEIFTLALDLQGNALVDQDHIEQLGVPVTTAARPVLDGQESETSTIVQAGAHSYQLYVKGVSSDDGLKAVVIAGTSLDLQEQRAGDLFHALALIYAAVLLLTFLSTLLLAERALSPARRAFARQRQFATAASHELRTPLAVIRSEAELAGGLIGDSLEALRGSQPADAATLDGYLSEALSETRNATDEVDFMSRMVQDLLLLARDASDSLAHAWKPVDVRGVVDEVLAKVRPLAESHDLTLRGMDTNGASTPIWVRGDADLLRQLLLGLLDNAVRYTPAGGVIQIGVRAESHIRVLGEHRRRAYISVSDTGIGIAPEHLPNIFEPFYRAITPSRPIGGEQSGTGLGLALAQWIVQAHGGSIEAQSTLGQGTTFTIALPLAGEEEERP